MRRREFLRAGLLGASTTVIGRGTFAVPASSAVPLAERIALFTDHLDDHGYSYAEVAKMIEPLKIAGPDLTVRGGGVVPPERAAEELPKAFAAFRDQGLSIPM